MAMNGNYETIFLEFQYEFLEKDFPRISVRVRRKKFMDTYSKLELSVLIETDFSEFIRVYQRTKILFRYNLLSEFSTFCFHRAETLLGFVFVLQLKFCREKATRSSWFRNNDRKRMCSLKHLS